MLQLSDSHCKAKINNKLPSSSWQIEGKGIQYTSFSAIREQLCRFTNSPFHCQHTAAGCRSGFAKCLLNSWHVFNPIKRYSAFFIRKFTAGCWF